MKIVTRLSNQFYVYSFQHIDNYEFIKKPEEVSEEIIVELPPLDKVKEAFKKYGWEGDGEFGIIWIPPFVMEIYHIGIYLWHVKQSNNGTSFIATKNELEPQICFDDFNCQNKKQMDAVLLMVDLDNIC